MPPPSRCPKCGHEREPDAAECSACGIVFARFDPYAQERGRTAPDEEWQVVFPELPNIYEGVAPDLPEVDMPEGDDEPRVGGVAGMPDYIRPSDLAETLVEGETALTRNLPIALVVFLLLYGGIATLWQQHLLGVEVDPEGVAERFATVSGLDPPEVLDPVVAMTFVGARLVLFASDGAGEEISTVLLLYEPGWFDGSVDLRSFEELVERRLDLLGIGWQVEVQHRGHLAHQDAPLQILGLGSSQDPVGSLFMTTFAAADGATLVMLGAGPHAKVMRQLRYYTQPR